MILDKKLMILSVAAIVTILAFYAVIQRSLRPVELDELELQATIAKYHYQTERLKDKAEVKENAFVKQADVVLAVFVRLSPLVALFCAFTFFMLRPMPFEIGTLKATVSRWNEKPVLHAALLVAGMSENTRALAFQESVANARADMLIKFAHAVKTPMLRGQSTHIPLMDSAAQSALPEATDAQVATLQSLINQGLIGPGQPICLGIDQSGQPEIRDIRSLKSMAAAGLQGSGKTLGVAYWTGSMVVNASAEAFIIDPHKQHPESLHSKMMSFIEKGLVTSVNPFEVGDALKDFDQRITNRLSGLESSDRPLVIVFDELAKLSKTDAIFDDLMLLLSRATEETRKTNVLVIGASPKWTARHFNGRADIRDGINTKCLFRMNKGAAELLCEDRDEQKLLKHVTQPGQFLFIPEESNSRILSIPFLTEGALEHMATLATTPAQAALPFVPATAQRTFQQELDALKLHMGLEELWRKSGLCNSMTLQTFQTKSKPSSARQFNASEERAIMEVKG